MKGEGIERALCLLNPEELTYYQSPGYVGTDRFLSRRMCSLISFRKSNPPQNRQLNILISNSKR